MKRTALALLLGCVIVLASTGVAYANYGPHGAYVSDTDACAACHRAHTSFSNLTWTDQTGFGQRSALLISQASDMTQFCEACHGDAAPGASTNVQSGVFDTGPTTAGSANPDNSSTFYKSASTLDATLNGGGFQFVDKYSGHAGMAVNSSHNMDGAANFNPALILWGNTDVNGNAALNTMSSFTCTDCHDPHGSSNYRLLKDVVNGKSVGGYNSSGNPAAVVISNELNFPQDGFAKGQAGVDEKAAYVPNYTTPEYAVSAGGGLNTWCAACHGAYAQQTSSYNYGNKLDIGSGTDASNGNAPYNFSTNNTAVTYHRHPVGVTLLANAPGASNPALTVPLQLDAGLPLEMPYGQGLSGSMSWNYSGAIDCLTCHAAHGTASTMSGWAISDLTGGTPEQLAKGTLTGTAASKTNANGTGPNYDAALLRYNNRGVCERCHNK